MAWGFVAQPGECSGDWAIYGNDIYIYIWYIDVYSTYIFTFILWCNHALMIDVLKGLLKTLEIYHGNDPCPMTRDIVVKSSFYSSPVLRKKWLLWDASCKRHEWPVIRHHFESIKKIEPALMVKQVVNKMEGAWCQHVEPGIGQPLSRSGKRLVKVLIGFWWGFRVLGPYKKRL